MKCIRCKKDLPESEFHINVRTGKLSQTCNFCTEQKRLWEQRKKLKLSNGNVNEIKQISRLEKKIIPPVIKVNPSEKIEHKKEEVKVCKPVPQIAGDKKFKTSKIRIVCFGKGRTVYFKVFEFNTDKGLILFIFRVSSKDENEILDLCFKRDFTIEQEERLLNSYGFKRVNSAEDKEHHLKSVYNPEKNPFFKEFSLILKLIRGRVTISKERRFELMEYFKTFDYEGLKQIIR